MQARLVPLAQKFIPFKIELTIESQEEAEGIHNIFNSSAIRVTTGIIGDSIRSAIKEALNKKETWQTPSWREFSDRVIK